VNTNRPPPPADTMKKDSGVGASHELCCNIKNGTLSAYNAGKYGNKEAIFCNCNMTLAHTTVTWHLHTHGKCVHKHTRVYM
jgi:hypothetical protein